MLIIKAVLICIIMISASWLLGKGLMPGTAKLGAGMSVATGVMIAWGLFYVVSIPVIILQKEGHGMDWVETGYSIVMIVALAVSLAHIIVRIVKKKVGDRPARVLLDNREIVYLSLFLGIVVFQLVKTVTFSYADGDDAYYVAVAQSVSGEKTALYSYDAYTGLETGIAYRYALAPFPLFISYFARLLDANAATVAHICMPVFLIPVTYILYNAIAKKIFKDNNSKRYMFLCLMSIYVMFSHYSYSAAEYFMLARTRQGKEALANIIIPFLFLVMIDITSREVWEIRISDLGLLLAICVSASLTSVFGNLLVLIMLFGNFIYSFIRKASWKDRILSVLPGAFNAMVIGLYIIL